MGNGQLVEQTQQVERSEGKTAPKEPSMYRVRMHNDDYTPMEFVIEVLEKFFSMSHDQATQTMLTVHYRGSAVCGIYTRDIAETKGGTSQPICTVVRTSATV